MRRRGVAVFGRTRFQRSKGFVADPKGDYAEVRKNPTLFRALGLYLAGQMEYNSIGFVELVEQLNPSTPNIDTKVAFLISRFVRGFFDRQHERSTQTWTVNVPKGQAKVLKTKIDSGTLDLLDLQTLAGGVADEIGSDMLNKFRGFFDTSQGAHKTFQDVQQFLTGKKEALPSLAAASKMKAAARTAGFDVRHLPF